MYVNERKKIMLFIAHYPPNLCDQFVTFPKDPCHNHNTLSERFPCCQGDHSSPPSAAYMGRWTDNGLSPGRRQAIIWTNDGIFLSGPLRTNFEIHAFSVKKMHLKMSSAKWRPFCPRRDELKEGFRLYFPATFLSTYAGSRKSPNDDLHDDEKEKHGKWALYDDVHQSNYTIAIEKNPSYIVVREATCCSAESEEHHGNRVRLK